MDKILFSTLIGLFAAFLTAVLGFTKLINDKEGKTSEFRQEWTNSIRKVLADLVSSFTNLIDLYEKSHKYSAVCYRLSNELFDLSQSDVSDNEYDNHKEGFLYNKKMLEMISDEVIEAKKNINAGISMALLHFKPNDIEFQHLEAKFDLVMKIISDINERDFSVPDEGHPRYLAARKKEVELICKDMLYISRSILKGEWERIKSGEINYIKTKRVFKVGSFLMTAAIGVLFLFITVSRFSNYLAEQKMEGLTIGGCRSSKACVILDGQVISSDVPTHKILPVRPDDLKAQPGGKSLSDEVKN